MRVILMSSSSGSEGGGEQYLIRLATGLARAGVEVLTAMSKHPRMDALERACAPFGEVRRINYRNLYDRRLRTGATLWARLTLGPLKEFFRSVRADVIHINKQNVEDGLDLLLAAQAVGAPTVSTIHITRSMQALGARAGVFRDWMANRILRRSPAQFITVARHCANDLINGCRGLAASRVHTVWNGVDAALAANRDVYRQEWQCRSNEVVLGCIARLEEQKDPLFALEILSRLPEHAKLVWVGDGRLREAFLRCTERLGVKHRVHLDGWRSDARQRLAAFDIFVLPSVYEGFPFAVVEAMAAGLPCVVSDVDGTREAVSDGTTGYLLQPRNLEQWLARLGPLLNDASQRKQLGRRGLERMERDFSLEAMTRSTIRVYEQALAQAGGATARVASHSPRSYAEKQTQ